MNSVFFPLLITSEVLVPINSPHTWLHSPWRQTVELLLERDLNKTNVMGLHLTYKVVVNLQQSVSMMKL